MQIINTHLKVGSNCLVKNRVYFCNITFNGVFYLDTQDFSIHFVHKFSFHPDYAVELSLNASLAYNNDIYFFPNNTNVILKYSILKQREEFIPIQDCNDKFCISSAIRRQDMVYMFPKNLERGIYVFDLKNQRVEKDKKLSSLFCSEFRCSKGHIFYDNKDCVMIGRYGGSQLLKINLVTKQIVFEKVMEGMQIYCMCFDGKHCWILTMDSTDIYEWDMENDTLQRYINKDISWRKKDCIGKQPYSNLVFLEDEILVLNCYAENIWRIDRDKKSIGNPIKYPKKFRMVNNQFCYWPVYAQYTMLGDKVLLYPYAGNVLLVYDIKTKEVSGKDLLVSDQEIPYLKEVLIENFMEKGECLENDDFGKLESFTSMVKTNNRNGQVRNHEKVGQTVWESLRKER